MAPGPSYVLAGAEFPVGGTCGGPSRTEGRRKRRFCCNLGWFVVFDVCVCPCVLYVCCLPLFCYCCLLFAAVLLLLFASVTAALLLLFACVGSCALLFFAFVQH